MSVREEIQQKFRGDCAEREVCEAAENNLSWKRGKMKGQDDVRDMIIIYQEFSSTGSKLRFAVERGGPAYAPRKKLEICRNRLYL
ncbi:hypothetical protein R1flu_016346 [Riccia fluitans]|uniref:Uncharacterized protein n=1 Tax=Riccia fluitans TaxID=41844 RepID=A0ABD1YME2_9MARC